MNRIFWNSLGLVWLVTIQSGISQEHVVTLPKMGEQLTSEQVTMFYDLALKNIDTEFPNKPGVVYSDEASVVRPREMFPAFYGSFDWHSCVHGHWMMIRLLKLYPGNERESAVREVLERHLTQENIAKEAELFAQKDNKSFERMYGWAWYLRMIVELETWSDTDAKRWRENLRPLEDVLVGHATEYLLNSAINSHWRTSRHGFCGSVAD
ncbi:MAG: DUF2891 family protein [Pirellulaceae bacterium]